jgi:hypothetical protein
VAKITGLQVSGPARSKRGRSANYKVVVRNGGNVAAQGVRLRVSGRGVKVNAPVGVIGAGKSRTTRLRVPFRTSGRVKITFTVSSSNAGGRSISRVVRVGR